MTYNYPTYPYYSQYAQGNISPSLPTIPQSQTCQGGSSLIWVQGEAGAKSYMVAPNTTVALWDSESQTVYLKSADASGMPSMRVLDYSIRDSMPQGLEKGSKTAYATKQELTTMQEEINEIKASIGVLKGGLNESTVQAT